MARNTLRTAEVLFLILCELYIVINGQRCLSNPEDLGLLVGRSPVVLEGRIVETQPSTFLPENSQLLDAVVDVVTVFKGQVDGGSQIVVGPFGATESTEECVGAARSVGEELVLFLNASGHVSGGVDGLPRFRLTANPRSADDESRRMVEEHASSSQGNRHSMICAETNYCLNGGTCYIMPALGLRLCKCTAEYEDRNRCQVKQTQGFGARKMREESDVKEYFFLIIIGSAAVFLVLVAGCILLVVFIRCKPSKRKETKASEEGIRIVKYRNVSTDPENNRTERKQISRVQSNIGVQTDSTNGVSLLLRRPSDADRNHGNGNGGKVRPNGPTYDEQNSRLHRPRRIPQDFQEPGPRSGRFPVSRGAVTEEPSRDARLVSVSFREKNNPPQTNSQGVRGVWHSRSLPTDDRSVQRGGRFDGASASRDSDLDSIPV